MFKDKILLITGGTGSFGNAVLDRFLSKGLREIRIFSRDEKKQDDMRKRYPNSNLKFFLGDVRNPGSLEYAMANVDFVFHAAALKQVPSCEFFPIEAFNTNVLGTENVIKVAVQHGVQRLICLSTDKAVYPINAMGMSKAMMEKIMVASSFQNRNSNIIISATRYGNVLGTRGSVIPMFVDQITKGIPLRITNPKMTRYIMTLSTAVDLVLFCFENAKTGDLFVQKSPAATIANIATATAACFGKTEYSWDIIGSRHGEKLHETLLSKEEQAKGVDLGQYIRVPADQRDLNYEKYFDEGDKHISKLLQADELNSSNAQQLNVEELSGYLQKTQVIQTALATNV